MLVTSAALPRPRNAQKVMYAAVPRSGFTVPSKAMTSPWEVTA